MRKFEPYSKYKPTKAEAKKPAIQRLMAAEETCWTLVLMMGLGLLEIPMEERKFLMESYEKWVDLAVETGILPKG